MVQRPGRRDAFPVGEHDHQSHRLVADLRASVARREYDADSTILIDRLSATSAEFVALWRRHEVAVPDRSPLRVRHPAVGPITLDCEILLTPSEDQRLLIYTAPPGSPDTDRLELLHVVGTQQFRGPE